MKNLYVAPSLRVIDLAAEGAILTASGESQRFEVGMSKETMGGSQALSNKQENIWGSESIWN